MEIIADPNIAILATFVQSIARLIPMEKIQMDAIAKDPMDLPADLVHAQVVYVFKPVLEEQVQWELVVTAQDQMNALQDIAPAMLVQVNVLSNIHRVIIQVDAFVILIHRTYVYQVYAPLVHAQHHHKHQATPAI